MYRTGYNPTTSPVVVDDEGRTIGGRDWGTYDSTERAANDALDRRDLIAVRDPDPSTEMPPGVNPRALRAFERTKVVRERKEKAAKVDKDKIRETVEDAGLIAPGSDPTVGAMREVLAEHPEVIIPDAEAEKPGKKTTRSTRSSQEA